MIVQHNKQKRIVIVSQYFWPETFKGNDIAVDFVKRGYQVTVLTGKPNYPQGKFYSGYSFFKKPTEIYKGINIIRVPLIPRGNNNLLLILNYLSFIFFGSWAALFRIKGSIDIIFVQQLSPVTVALPAILLKKIKKVPLILWVLDLWPESITATTNINNTLILNLLKRLVHFVYQSSDRILISSKNFKISITQILGKTSKPIDYFPNWAEDVFLESVNKPSQFELPEQSGNFNIIYAGNIGEAQDFESVLKAVELTRTAHINWVFIGDGRKKKWIEIEKQKRNLSNLFLLGRYPLEDMPSIFQKADAMLVSLKNEPIFELTVPAKIQAYLASGKAILGMLNGEGAQIINQSGAGLACQAGQADELAQNAIRLSQLPQKEHLQKERHAKKYYQKYFNKQKLFDFLDNMFQSMVQ